MSSNNAEQREIDAEQTYVDAVYERLDASAKVAQSLVVEGMARGHVGNEGGLVERDAMVYQASLRLSALNAAHDGLVFGRLNMLDGESRYIGRIGVRDADREILLIDWRAPAAAIFYQATAQEPAGVIRRRVLRCANDKVIGIEDDLLDADNAPDDLVVIGEGALLASLTRARDSSMHSVVATIQKEQDEAIRAPSRGATTIGGGPGTGKTVVALHRAAYLLYTDRRRFESGGVLVVGPSTVFMNYIERVLPSLGETSVTLRSLGEVVDGLRAMRHDEPVAAAAKGSSRMPAFLARAAAAPMPGAPTEFRYFYKDDVLRLDAAAARAHPAQPAVGRQAQPRLPQGAGGPRRRTVGAGRRRARAREGRGRVRRDHHDRRPLRRLRRGLVAAGRADRRVAHAARRDRRARARGVQRRRARCAQGVVGDRRAEHRGRAADRRAALRHRRGAGDRAATMTTHPSSS